MSSRANVPSSSALAWAFGMLFHYLGRGEGHWPGRHGEAGATSRLRAQHASGSPHPWPVPCGNSGVDASALLTALTEDIVLIANAMVGVPQLCINIPLVVACVIYIGWLSPVIFVWGVSSPPLQSEPTSVSRTRDQ